MRYEVELKFRVDDFQKLERLLHNRAARLGSSIEQVDTYFAHPARDFSQTDEAFRLRRTGASNSVTYKGPKIDSLTKTRAELELPLPDGEDYFRQFTLLLEALGFRRVADVHKHRRKALLEGEGVRTEVSLDEVRGVGCYVELEQMADEQEVDACRERLQKIAKELGLTHTERRSYLELLLIGQGRSRAEGFDATD